ncbi:MAG: HIT domain-containing protein [Deltaproteobacteria bacterium]|nr:HIT domain-containing protein [Deltaproteobacteria bacterium]
MERLWAPWRMAYIEGAPTAGCFLCVGEDAGADEARLLLARARRTLVMLNRFPYNSGHLLVAPLRHTGALEGLAEEEAAELIVTLQRATDRLQQALHPDGFNIGLNLGKAAGAGLEEHLHFHIVPRWNGDTNFMPVLGEAKVVPEYLVATYRKLRPFFDRL